MARSRRPSSPSPGPAHPLEDDDLLHEILLRVPPQPPYLLRASLVSKRWRSLATDPKFLGRFRLHHRKPPLLGVFSGSRRISFRSTLDSPYRIPPERFSPRLEGPDGRDWTCLDCRHGRVLFDDWGLHQVIVWDPITDEYRIVANTPRFHGPGKVALHRGAVLCSDGDQGHAHGACHSSPFKVAVLGIYEHNDYDDDDPVAFASVYSSETNTWCDLLSTVLPHRGTISQSSTLVGNTLHWFSSYGILEFDLDTQKLAVIKRPPCADYVYRALAIQAEDGGLGVAVLSCTPYQQTCDTCLQIWEREAHSYGVATWVLRKTAELQKILGLGFPIYKVTMMHYAEDVNAIFLWADSSVYMVQLGSMQSEELFRDDPCRSVRPFTSFYTEDGGLLILQLLKGTSVGVRKQ